MSAGRLLTLQFRTKSLRRGSRQLALLLYEATVAVAAAYLAAIW